MADKINGNTRGSVTIKDISEKLNVSAVSVHRALAGKEGVSDQLRRRVLETAKEMGYEFNYAAASLKRKPCRVAAILPQDDGLYFSYIWKGLEACIKEVKRLNVEVEKHVCTNEDHQYELLKRIADDDEDYSGVVTFSYTRQPRVLLHLQRLVARGKAVVVIDDELKEPEGLYCIPSNEKKVGIIAGEAVELMAPESGSVLVSSGRLDSKIHINKINSFKEYLSNRRPGLKIHTVEGYYSGPGSDQAFSREVLKALEKYPDTVACYALTSHENLPMAQAVREAGMEARVSVIGTDLNEITINLLKERRLKAVINQAGSMKGYAGLSVLVDRVVKNIEPPLRIDCPIDVILHSNLSFFECSNKFISWR